MKAPSFQFYPADWQRDLSEHPLEIEGAWIRVCCALWWSDTPGNSTKPLTNWARIMRVGERKCKTIIDYLLNQKIAEVVIQNQNITITSRRMVKDEHIRNVRRTAGFLGGNPSLIKPKNEPDLVKQNLVNQKPTPSSSSSNTKNIYTDEFLKFYAAYPNKKAKLEAFKAWNKSNGSRPPIDDLVAAVERQKQSPEWKKDNGQFIPHPATWINKGRWDDEVIAGGPKW
jgi:hypothetical protein